jgi:hypothetical protein
MRPKPTVALIARARPDAAIAISGTPAARYGASAARTCSAEYPLSVPSAMTLLFHGIPSRCGNIRGRDTLRPL